MLNMTLYLEDTLIVADLNQLPVADDDYKNRVERTNPNPYTWDVLVIDLPSSKTQKARWTNDQFATVVALSLGVGEDKTPGFDVDLLYSVAEPLIAGWPTEIRPIP